MKTTNPALVSAVERTLANMLPGTSQGLFRAMVLRPGLAEAFAVNDQPLMSASAAAEYLVSTYVQS